MKWEFTALQRPIGKRPLLLMLGVLLVFDIYVVSVMLPVREKQQISRPGLSFRPNANDWDIRTKRGEYSHLSGLALDIYYFGPVVLARKTRTQIFINDCGMLVDVETNSFAVNGVARAMPERNSDQE